MSNNHSGVVCGWKISAKPWWSTPGTAGRLARSALQRMGPARTVDGPLLAPRMTSGNVFPRFSRPGGFGGEMMSCRDVDFDGGFVAKGDTEQDSLQPAAEHARAVHNLNEITPGIAEKGKSTIQADAA